jgi:GntR family transcriptional regulator
LTQQDQPRGGGGQPARPAAALLGLTRPVIVKERGSTAHGQIEEWLGEAIEGGRLAPGDRMPTEQDLSEWLGVSRMTLRHALATLSRRGLVDRAVGRNGGTFVAQRKLEQDRTTLAGFSEQLRRHGMVAGARVLSAAERPARPGVAAALKIAAGDPVCEIRRVRLGDGSPIAVECSSFPAALFPGLLQCRLDGSLYDLLDEKYQQRPCRARESLEPVTAGVREAEALEVREGAPLMLVERIAYAQAGHPVEFARDLFRGDRTRIVMWTSELTHVG